MTDSICGWWYLVIVGQKFLCGSQIAFQARSMLYGDNKASGHNPSVSDL